MVIAPIASASAAPVVGACTINGTAKFGGKLSTGAPRPTSFEFTGEGGKCVGVEGTAPAVENVEASHVKGKGELACAVSENVLEITNGSKIEGSGDITIEKHTKKEFAFKFVAAGGAVAFTALGPGVTGLGAAEFLTDPTGVAECLPVLGAGPESLKFQAVVAGTFE